MAYIYAGFCIKNELRSPKLAFRVYLIVLLASSLPSQLNYLCFWFFVFPQTYLNNLPVPSVSESVIQPAIRHLNVVFFVVYTLIA